MRPKRTIALAPFIPWHKRPRQPSKVCPECSDGECQICRKTARDCQCRDCDREAEEYLIPLIAGVPARNLLFGFCPQHVEEALGPVWACVRQEKKA